MLEIKLDNIAADGDGHVAYLQIIERETGKVMDKKCLKYETETKFDNAAKKYLADYKEKHTPKEDIKTNVLNKLATINKGETP